MELHSNVPEAGQNVISTGSSLSNGLKCMPNIWRPEKYGYDFADDIFNAFVRIF